MAAVQKLEQEKQSISDGAKKEPKLDGTVYLLNNQSSRIIKIEGIRIVVGVNKLSNVDLFKLEKSPYFSLYFDDEDIKDRFEWVTGFGPSDQSTKNIVDLPLAKAKKVIKEVFEINFLNQLEIDCKDADLKDAILKQKKEVMPSEKETK